MHKNAARCFFILLFSSVTLAAGTRLSAAQDDVVRMSYVSRDLNGAERWKAESEIRNKAGDIYTMVEKVSGYYSGLKGRISWVAKMEFEDKGDNIRPISLDKRIVDEKGNTLRVEKQIFDLAGNSATCTHEDPTRNIFRTKTFRFNKDVVNRLSMGLYSRKLISSGKTSKKVQMVSEEPNVYDMELRIVDKEEMEVNGKKVTAYKLVIDPQLGFLDAVKVFLPKAYAWHSVDAPFRWLRYAGLEGGISSMKVEVTTLD